MTRPTCVKTEKLCRRSSAVLYSTGNFTRGHRIHGEVHTLHVTVLESQVSTVVAKPQWEYYLWKLAQYLAHLTEIVFASLVYMCGLEQKLSQVLCHLWVQDGCILNHQIRRRYYNKEPKQKPITLNRTVSLSRSSFWGEPSLTELEAYWLQLQLETVFSEHIKSTWKLQCYYDYYTTHCCTCWTTCGI